MDLIRVATGPDSDPDNIIARKVYPSKHEAADKTVGTNPTGIRSEDSGVDENTVACAMDDDRGHVDEPVTSEGHNVPPDDPRGVGGEGAGVVLHRPSQDPNRLSEEQHAGIDQLPQRQEVAGQGKGLRQALQHGVGGGQRGVDYRTQGLA